MHVPILIGPTATLDPNVRSAPVIAEGTLKTDTGQIIRSAAQLFIANTATDAQNPAKWAACRALGLNTVRCPVTAGRYDKTLAQIGTMIDGVVNAARNNRMYMSLEYAFDPPGEFGDSIASRDKAMEFWAFMAPRYASEPHVFYEMVNEPSKWGEAPDYISSAATGNVPTDVLRWCRQVFDVMRAGAPDKVIATWSVGSVAPYANRYRTVLQAFEALGSPVDWTKTVFSFHWYNPTYVFGVVNASATDGGAAGLNALRGWGYPLLCTEWNYWVEPPPGGRPLIQYAMRIAEEQQIGWTILLAPGKTPDYLRIVIDDLRANGAIIPVE